MPNDIMQKAIRLVDALNRFHGYDDDVKKEFGLAAKSLLRAWQAKHKLEGTIHWNKGGMAVSGEVCFKNEYMEIWIQEPFGGGEPIMFRGLFMNGGRQDSGSNNFASPTKFASMPLEQIESMCGRRFGQHHPIVVTDKDTYQWNMCAGAEPVTY